MSRYDKLHDYMNNRKTETSKQSQVQSNNTNNMQTVKTETKYDKLNNYIKNRDNKSSLMESVDGKSSDKFNNLKKYYQQTYIPKKANEYFSGVNNFSQEYNNYLKSAGDAYQSAETLKGWDEKRKDAYSNGNKEYALALSYLTKSDDIKNSIINTQRAHDASRTANQSLTDFYSQFENEDTYNNWKKSQELLNYDIDAGEKRLKDIEEQYGYSAADKRMKELQSLGYTNQNIKDEMYSIDQQISKLNNDEEYNRIKSEIEEARSAQEFSYRYKTDPQFAAEYDKYVAEREEFNQWYDSQNWAMQGLSQIGNTFKNWAWNTSDTFYGMAQASTNAANNLLYGTSQAPEGTINAELQKIYDISHAEKAKQDMFNEFYEKGLARNVGSDFLASAATIALNAVPETISTLGMAYLSGGTSLAASGAGNLLGKTGKTAITATLKNLTKNPSMYYTFMREGGAAYNEAIQAGATDLEATVAMLATGLPNALIEIGGGIEELPALKDVKGVKQWIKQIAETGVDEAKEEVLQGIVSQLVAQSTYAPETSLFSTDGSGIIDPVRMIQEAYGGFVGGVLGGAVGTVTNRISQASYDKAYNDYKVSDIESNFDNISDFINTIDENSDLAKLYNRISSARANNEKVSKADYIALYDAVDTEERVQMKNSLSRGLADIGVSENEIVRILPALEKMTSGNEISKAEAQAIINNPQLNSLFSNAIGENIDVPTLTGWTSSTITPERMSISENESGKAFELTPSLVVNEIIRMGSDNADYTIAENSMRAEQGRQLIGLIEDEVKSELKGDLSPAVTVNGQDTNITGIDSKTNDGLFIVLENGDTVNIKDIDFGDNSVTEALYTAAADSNLDTDAVKSFIKYYDGTSTIGQYAGMYGAIYNVAKTGMSETDVENLYSAAVNDGFISPVAAKAAYFAGENAAKASRKAYGEQIANRKSGQSKFHTEVKDKSKGVATKEQKKLAAFVSKATGYTVELINGAVDTEENAIGSIDSNNALIRLDVSNGKYAATALHEVTHFIAVNAPAQFKRFRDAVIKFEIKQGRLATDLNRYAQNYKGLDNINDITEEMAADAAEALLKSDDFLVDLMSDKEFVDAMAQESPSIAKKIFNKLQELIDAIRDFISNSDVEHNIAKAISQDVDALENMKELWLDAFKASIRNRAAQHKDGSKVKEDTKGINEKLSIAEITSDDISEKTKESANRILSSDISNIRSIGKKRINDFTKEEIKNNWKWVSKLYQELGTKSPFFKAWFGDWRAYDTNTTNIIRDIKDDSIRGSVINSDTGWEIIISKKIHKETTHHSSASVKGATKYLPYIKSITKNAIMFDTSISDKNNPLSVMYHTFYAYTEMMGYPAVLKLRIEELADEKTGNAIRRDYILQEIKEEPISESKRFSKAHQSETDSSIISISDLYEIVKTLDKDFNGNPVDKSRLNSDGTPKNEYISKYLSENSIVNQHATDNSDIRRSIPEQTDGEYEALLHENEQLQQQIETLKSEMQITKGHKVNPAAVQKFARKLIKDYSSTIDVDKLSERLENVFNYIASEDAIGSLAQEVMYSIAKDILTQSESYNTELSETYKEARDFLRNTKIHVTEGAKAELDYIFGSYSTFHKANFGRLKLSLNEGRAIDDVYQELATLAPGYFSDQMISDKDMLPNIAEFIQATNPFIENVYEQDMEQYTSDLAQEIFNQYFETPEVKTFADKQAEMLQKAVNKSRKTLAERREADQQRYEKRLAKVKDENKAKIERLQERINDMRDKNDQATKDLKAKLYAQIGELKSKQQEKLLAQKAKYQDMATRKAERNKENAERSKSIKNIKKNAKEILQWIEKPTDKKHVPETLLSIIPELFSTIDFISERQEANAANGKVSNEYLFWIKATELYMSMSSEKFKTEDSAIFLEELDPDFLPRLSEFIKLNRQTRKISEMDTAQLKELDTLVTSLKHAITSINKLYTNRITENLAELGDMTTDELYSRDTKENLGKVVGWIDKVLNVSMLIPMDFFERMGVAGESIYRSIKDADNKFVSNVEKAQNFMEDLLKDKDVKSWINKSEIYEVEAGGKTLKLDTVRIMGLYVLWSREQAKDHIIKGGIVPTDIGKGKKALHQVDPIRPSEQVLLEFFQKLTPEQKQVAEAMQKYLSTEVSDWGNEVSLERYGYKKFTEEYYWPIRSIDNEVNSSDSNTTQTGLFRINNLGMTKSTVKNANNAIEVDDIFKTFSNHVVEMALYASYGPALSDAMKWYNYKNRKGENVKTVKGGIERVYGSEAKQYFIKLIQDLNNVKGGYNLEASILNSFVGKSKAAAVAGNVRVALQQPTSIARAAAVINPKYIVQGSKRMLSHPKKTINEAKKHAPIAVWKSWGYYDTNIGRNLQQVITGQASFKDKFVEKTMLLAQYGDTLTMGSLWEACKAEITDTRTDLTVGSDKFYEAVHERYDYIIDRTQVVDGVLQRSQAMRNKDGVVKMATAFMAEPTKTFNLMRRAIADIANNKNGENNLNFGRTSAAVVFTAALTAAAAAISDAFRDTDDSKDWAEKYIDNFYHNLIDNINPLNMIPWVKDVANAWQGYDVERTDVSAAVGFMQLIQSTINKVENGKDIDPFNLFYNTSRYVSQMTGVPLFALLREADSVIDIFGDPVFRNKSETKTSDIYASLYRAALDGNEQAYTDSYNRLVESGKTDKDIESGLRSLIMDAESDIYDNRIYEAAWYRINGNTSGYLEILDALIDGSGLSQDFWVKTINLEINRINSEGKELSEYRQILIDSGLSAQTVDQMDIEQMKEVAASIEIDTSDPTSLTVGESLSLYNTTDLTVAITNRNAKTFDEVYHDILSAKTLQYMLKDDILTDKEAEKKAKSSLKASITAQMKPIVKELHDADYDEFKKLRSFLQKNVGYDSSTVNGWTIEE